MTQWFRNDFVFVQTLEFISTSIELMIKIASDSFIEGKKILGERWCAPLLPVMTNIKFW